MPTQTYAFPIRHFKVAHFNERKLKCKQMILTLNSDKYDDNEKETFRIVDNLEPSWLKEKPAISKIMLGCLTHILEGK